MFESNMHKVGGTQSVAFFLIALIAMIGVCKPLCADQSRSKYDKFGGWKEIKGEKTGFFHVEQIDGIWWIIDPCGFAFLSKGIDSVDLSDSTYSFGQPPAPKFPIVSEYVNNVLPKYKTEKNWTSSKICQIEGFGFNTAGDFSSSFYVTSPNSAIKRIPYVVEVAPALTNGLNFAAPMLDFFTNNFAVTFSQGCLENCAPRRDDPYLIGYYLGSEIVFGANIANGFHLMLEIYLSFAGGPGRNVALGIIENFYGNNISTLNAAWGTSFAAFTDITINPSAQVPTFSFGPANSLLAQYSQALGEAKTYIWVQNYLTNEGFTAADVVSYLSIFFPNVAAYNATFNTTYASFNDVAMQPITPLVADLQALEGKVITAVATQFYQLATSSVLAQDPNHMIMGIKTFFTSTGWVPAESITPAVLQNVDVFSFDFYVDNVTFLTGNPGDNSFPFANANPTSMVDVLKYINLTSRKPVFLAEYSFKALDSGLPNTNGAGLTVNTQAQRTEGYKIQTVDLMTLPFAVGYNWFQLLDEPAAGRFEDGENSNFGILNVNDQIYEQLTTAMTKLNCKLEKIHLKGAI